MDHAAASRTAALRAERLAILALLVGAVTTAFAPILVRLSELGPTPTAFYRFLLAAPLYWVMALPVPGGGRRLRREKPDGSRVYLLMAMAGAFFAGDILAWHYSIHMTTVANASLLLNVTPVFVVLAGWLLFRARVTGTFMAGLATAMAGVGVLSGASLALSRTHVAGDALGVVTAMFYAAYQLTVEGLRRRFSTVTIMIYAVPVSALVALPAALLSGESMAVTTPAGWAVLVALAAGPQVLGQGPDRLGPGAPAGELRFRQSPGAADRRRLGGLVPVRRAYRRAAGGRRRCGADGDHHRAARQRAPVTGMRERELLRGLFDAAVAAADPAKVVPPHLPSPPRGRTLVLAAGKAAASMARAVEQSWPTGIEGIAVTRYGHGVDCERIEVVEAGHPLPDEAGQNAAARFLSAAAGLGPDDLLLFLLSGGASALLVEPQPGLGLADKQAVNRALLEAGAPIAEMNCLRKHLSAIKGGRLAAAAAPARVVTLAISDVPGDDPAVIGSGPTVGGPHHLRRRARGRRPLRRRVAPCCADRAGAGQVGDREARRSVSHPDRLRGCRPPGGRACSRRCQGP